MQISDARVMLSTLAIILIVGAFTLLCFAVTSENAKTVDCNSLSIAYEKNLVAQKRLVSALNGQIAAYEKELLGQAKLIVVYKSMLGEPTTDADMYWIRKESSPHPSP